MALIKKSLMALILLVPFLLGVNNYVNAYGSGIVVSEPEEDNNGADIYHSMVEDRLAYVHMSLPRYTSSGAFMTSYVSNTDHEIKFYGSKDIHFDRNIFNPDASEYTLFVIESRSQNGSFVIDYSSKVASHNFIRVIGTSEGIEIRTIIEQPGPDLEEKVYTLVDSVGYRIYWAKSMTYKNVPIESLPNTVGSPYTPGQYGQVKLTLNGSNLNIEITYTDTYELASMLVDNKTTFENVKTAYYWTDNGSKFITMTYEEKEPVYLSNLPIQAQPWTDTVTWNLTTNEIRSVNKVDVFAYHEKDSNRNIFTYMYMPNQIHDSLISVTAKIGYRFEWYIGGKSEVRTDTISLKSGDKNSFSPKWEKKFLYHALTPLYTVIDVGSKLFDYQTPFTQGSLDQIQVVGYPTSELTSKITTAWNEAYDTNVVIDTDSNKLYKLNWGQFDELGARHVSLVENAFQFTEIVFVKDGKVNLLTFDDIILKDVTDKTLLPGADNGLIKMFIDLIKANPLVSGILAIVIVSVLLFTFSGLVMPIASLLGVFVRVIAAITQVLGNILVKLIVMPWFWLICCGVGLFYYIYTNV